MFTQAPHHEDVWGSGSIDPCISIVSSTRMWAITCMPRLLYPGNKPRVPVNDALWPGLRTGLNAVEKRELLAPAGTRIPYLSVIQPVTYSLHQLSYPDPDLMFCWRVLSSVSSCSVVETYWRFGGGYYLRDVSKFLLHYTASQSIIY
jgi:hypothetical protein